MGKVCMECLDAFKDNAITTSYKTSMEGLYQDCPKRTCGGRIYTIDDSILPTIILLNSKGYTTYSSCGGHYLEEDTEIYIEFDESIKQLPGKPPLFRTRVRRTESGSRLVLYYKPFVDDPFEEFPELLAAAEELYEWALDIEPPFDFPYVIIDSVDLGGLMDLNSIFGINEKKETPEEKKARVKENLKKVAPTGSIQLDAPEAAAAEPAAEKAEEDKPKETPLKAKKPRRKKEDPPKETE